MTRRYRSAGRDQGWLFPVDLRAMLPSGHLAWQVLDAVAELDLAGFAARYRDDGQGEAPYDPAVMVALVFYCLLKGIRSCRKIAAACTDDLGAVVICGGRRPHYSTVSRFLTRHRAELKRLFVQVLGLCVAGGLVDPAVAAVDGSPVSANAARSSNAGAGKLAEMITALQSQVDAEVEAMFAEVERAGAAQPPLDGWDEAGGGDDDDLPGGAGRPLAAKIARLARLRRAQAKLAGRAAAGQAGARAQAAEDKAARLEERVRQMSEDARARAAADAAARAGAAAAGRPARHGPKVVPPERSKTIARQRAKAAAARQRADAARARAAAPVTVSATDPDSRLVPRKNGGYEQGWNLQITATRRQFLLSIGLHDAPNDKEALTGAVTAAIINCDAAGLDQAIAAWLAGSGYASAANFEALDYLNLLVAVCKDRVQAGRTGGDDADIPAAWQDMAARLATPDGTALYKRRSPTVEPAFAQLFARFGRYISRRGSDAADTEIKLLGSAHNLAKLLAARQRARRPAAQPA